MRMELIITNIKEKDFTLILGLIASAIVEDAKMDALYTNEGGKPTLIMKDEEEQE